MTFRGVYRDGIVVLGDIGLADGTPVDVNPSRPSKQKTTSADPAKKNSRPTRRGKARKAASEREDLSARPLIESPAIGLWEKRREWKGKSTIDIAAELRERFMGGESRGGRGRRG